MSAPSPRAAERIFKTAWFAKAARKAGIKDVELCRAIKQVIDGKCDDLGGGVFKKRVSNNLYRSIILAKGGRHWVYEYVFAKKDRANIDDAELQGFRKLAKGYEKLTTPQLAQLLKDNDLTEICHGDQAEVSE
ncbi:MAG: type II toxin-antitoxin system RelE/ParE family toxin [Gemmatimonadaceae bacterium]